MYWMGMSVNKIRSQYIDLFQQKGNDILLKGSISRYPHPFMDLQKNKCIGNPKL